MAYRVAYIVLGISSAIWLAAYLVDLRPVILVAGFLAGVIAVGITFVDIRRDLRIRAEIQRLRKEGE